MTTVPPIRRVLTALSVAVALVASVLLGAPQAASAQDTQATAEYLVFTNGLSGPGMSIESAVLSDVDLIRGNNADEVVRNGSGDAIFQPFFEFVQTGNTLDSVERVDRQPDSLVAVSFTDGSTVSNVRALRDFASFNFGGSRSRFILDETQLGGRSLADVTAVSVQQSDASHNASWADFGFVETPAPPAPVPNTIPVVRGDSYVAQSGSTLTVPAIEGLLANDFDSDGDQLTAAVSSTNSLAGSLALNADGSFSFTPSNGFTGRTFASIQVSDGEATRFSNLWFVVQSATPTGNAAPIANFDSFSVVAGTTTTISADFRWVSANDVYADRDTLSSELVAATPGLNVIVEPTGQVTISPDATFTGSGTFLYRVSDGFNSDVGTASVQVRPGTGDPSPVPPPPSTPVPPVPVPPADLPDSGNTAQYLVFTNGLSGPGQSIETASLFDVDLVRGDDGGESIRNSAGDEIFEPFFEFVLTGTDLDSVVRVERHPEALVTVSFTNGPSISGVRALRDFASFNFGGSRSRFILDQTQLGGRSLAEVTGVTVDQDVAHNASWADFGFGDATTPPVTPPAPEPTPEPPAPEAGTVLFSLARNQGGFADEDIVEFDPATGDTSVFFDGSDVGIRRADIKAFAEMADGSLLIALNRDTTVDGVTAGRNDILRFVPTSLGSNTAGTFSIFLDGSDVGLTTNGERIDGVDVISEDGGTVTLAISTAGAIRVPGLRGGDEDLTALTLTRSGASSQGTWARYFDGSDLGLTDRSEDVAAASVVDGELLFATNGPFSASGASGNASDIVSCDGFSAGGNTSCGTVSVAFNAAAAGLDGARFDGLEGR